jgi:hypothetical protein
MMPPYRYLFQERPIGATGAQPADALLVTGEGAARKAIVPTEQARALAAYLLSLRSEVDLFEAPSPKVPAAPAPATNTVASVSAP